MLLETPDGGHMGWAGRGAFGPELFAASWADGVAARVPKLSSALTSSMVGSPLGVSAL